MVQAFAPVTLATAALSLTASAAGVWAAIRLAERAGMLDLPDGRRSHSLPTPRMGGVPMVLASALAYGCWARFFAVGGAPGKGLSHAFLFALSMAVLGFADDLEELSPLFRFLVQIVLAFLFFWALAPLFPAVSLAGRTFPATVGIPIGAIWAVWMLNLYNFMDGIDGLAGGEAAVASCFFFLVFAHYGESGWAVANLFVAASAMGFLVHNWPPARVFMGDAGSQYLGAFFGVQSVVASLATSVPFPVLVLPFANFILDTTATLLRRMWRKEKWYQPHRSHYYQRMVSLGMTHRKVTLLELAASVACCGAALGYLGAGSTGRAIIIAVILSGHAAMGIRIALGERKAKATGHGGG